MSEFVLTDEQEAWLQALESGEYKQHTTTPALCAVDDDGNRTYCCLGVADQLFGTELEEQDMPGRIWFASDPDLRGRERGTGRAICSLPTVRRLHLRSAWGDIENGWALRGKRIHELTVANDEGRTFAEIAEFIRANPEWVFTQGKEVS